MVKESINGKERVLLCVNASLQRKAKDLIILNVKEFSSIADYFIICSGTSDRQVQAIAASIHENLKEYGVLPLGIEGERIGKWVLMDYEDVIIHIFYEPIREFYDIERLWSDVPCMEIGDDLTELTALDKGM
ncbi:MAG: ribosome silencing factor [Deltaproteobacteria bacterium]|nr:ribosome silencing factor [Deltaproteobacteria bacterium]